MLLNHKEVAIVGAGPVGLTMARLLQQRGARVTVYERDVNPQARIWGGTLDLHKQSGQQALKAAGLLNNYYQAALPMGIHIADEQGQIQYTRRPTPENQYDNPEINRNDLRTLLWNSLADGTVLWDSRLTALEPHNGRWLLRFAHQPDAVADVVIGANGGMSKVRGYVTDAQVEDTGTFIIQGDVPQPEINNPEFYALCGGNRLMAAHQGNLIVANPYNKGSLTYGVIFKKPATWESHPPLNFQDTDSVTAFLRHRFTGWSRLYLNLFGSTAAYVGLPTRKLPLSPAWKTNRPLPVTLIGDAAHLMPPFAGQGVNTGLMDALILSDCLTGSSYSTIQEAIQAYEQQMLVYAAQAQQESSTNEIEMRSPDFSFRQFIG